MKKLILSAALVLGSLTTFAQETPATTAKTATPQETKQTVYKEITSAEVPEVIKTSLAKTYPTGVIEKAYVSDLKEYKLEVTAGDQKGTLYSDEKGNWIKK